MTIKESKTFEVLYSLDKNNKCREWEIKVESYEDYSEIVTLHGVENGKKTEARIRVSQGKNVGKTNETDHYQQAIKDAMSKWTKKIDIEEYFVKMKDDNTQVKVEKNPLPMLANDYKKNKTKVEKLISESKIAVQPKLDGYRMIYNTSTNSITTRQGKEYSIVKQSGKLYEELLKLPKGLILDGELFTNKINFEVLGVLRKTKSLTDVDKVNLSKIEYHIYDIIDTKITFEERNKKIRELLGSKSFERLMYVPTFTVSSEEEIKNYHSKFLQENYEGTMIRNRDSMYKVKHRSNDLLKYKDFEDAEFEILDYTFEKDTSGNDDNLIVWIIGVPVVSTMVKCKVRPKGSKEERKMLYKKSLDDFSQFKGRNLWTKYFEKTKDGNLRFPSTVRDSYTDYIRDNIL